MSVDVVMVSPPRIWSGRLIRNLSPGLPQTTLPVQLQSRAGEWTSAIFSHDRYAFCGIQNDERNLREMVYNL